MNEKETYEIHKSHKERQTGLEPATSTLARWRTTNCTTIASIKLCSSEQYLLYRTKKELSTKK